jgi:hypothetical protein
VEAPRAIKISEPVWLYVLEPLFWVILMRFGSSAIAFKMVTASLKILFRGVGF